jgi:hypothetical protein
MKYRNEKDLNHLLSLLSSQVSRHGIFLFLLDSYSHPLPCSFHLPRTPYLYLRFMVCDNAISDARNSSRLMY